MPPIFDYAGIWKMLCKFHAQYNFHVLHFDMYLWISTLLQEHENAVEKTIFGFHNTLSYTSYGGTAAINQYTYENYYFNPLMHNVSKWWDTV